MIKKAVVMLPALVIVAAVLTFLFMGVITVKPNASTNKTLAFQGCLMSYTYDAANTNVVDSTFLIFSNRTFTYAGYLALENNHLYNITYYSDDPSEALTVTDLTSISPSSPLSGPS